MTQNGKVVSIEGNMAKVVVIRKSACDGCKQKNLCAGISDGCSEGKPIIAVAKNPKGASVGDEVMLESSSGAILGMTFAVFVLPLIIGFAAYAIFANFVTGTALYVISGAAFVIPLACMCFFLNRAVKKNPGVEIVKIIKKENTEQ